MDSIQKQQKAGKLISPEHVAQQIYLQELDKQHTHISQVMDMADNLNYEWEDDLEVPEKYWNLDFDKEIIAEHWRNSHEDNGVVLYNISPVHDYDEQFKNLIEAVTPSSVIIYDHKTYTLTNKVTTTTIEEHLEEYKKIKSKNPDKKLIIRRILVRDINETVSSLYILL